MFRKLHCCIPGKLRQRRGRRQDKKRQSEKPTGVLLQSAHSRFDAPVLVPLPASACELLFLTHNMRIFLTVPDSVARYAASNDLKTRVHCVLCCLVFYWGGLSSVMFAWVVSTTNFFTSPVHHPIYGIKASAYASPSDCSCTVTRSC